MNECMCINCVRSIINNARNFSKNTPRTHFFFNLVWIEESLFIFLFDESIQIETIKENKNVKNLLAKCFLLGFQVRFSIVLTLNIC